MGLRRLKLTAACALALITVGGLSACGRGHEPGVDEPAREGLAIDVAGIAYNVFLTRELNLNITPDRAFYDKPAEPGRALYGVFLQACNEGSKPRMTASSFHVEDNQGNEFEPVEVEEDNPFIYHPGKLLPGDCIPEAGSVAEFGPTAASILLFNFPLAATENRPLELKIEGPYDFEEGERETKTVELDL